MSRPVVMWGATGQAKVLRECLGPEYRVIAVFDNDATTASPFQGVPIFHGKQGFARWRQSAPPDVAFMVAIGGDKGRDRLELLSFLQDSGLRPLTVVHPTAYVAANATLGKGCQVLARACVGVEAELADACIVNTGAIVDHECRLSEGAHVAPGATLAGCVRLGPRAFIGAGAVVLPRIRVGSDAVVGAGSVVTQDVPDGEVVAGCPAVPVRAKAR